MDKKLEMSFDPHTIEHLGIKMYSNLPNALAELIANAYDAEAKNVYIKLCSREEDKHITIADDGLGMTFNEINDNFLRIGRKRRNDDNGISPNKLRKVTGRKGLGKLAFFGIADSIIIITKKDGECVKFVLSWSELINCSTTNYEPKYEISNCPKNDTGTKIILKQLRRKSDFDKQGLVISLSKLFNFFSDDFKVFVSDDNDNNILIDSKIKYRDIDKQFEWKFPDDQSIKNDFLLNNKVHGCIIATKKPLKPGLRGITLFAHGRMINIPEFFGISESSHAYSYLTGWLDVDFVDEMKDDVISTDRQSLNWDLDITAKLRSNLVKLIRDIERDWRDKRKEQRNKSISSESKINITDWYNKLPKDIKPNVEKIINSVVEDSELPGEKQNEIVSIVHKLIPEYPYYHWRHIHETVKSASYCDYQKRDYYRAVEEAIKRYECIVQESSQIQDKNGKDLMGHVFGKDKILAVVSKYKKTNGRDFNNDTKENIEECQKFMSMGMMIGVRNPLAHEEIMELKTSGLFTEKDCLDILSLLSHLFRRLDNAEKK